MVETEQLLSLPISSQKADWLKSAIRDVPDFPKPGIVFKDMTTLWQDAAAFQFVVDVLTQECARLKPSKIVGIEARGFVLAPVIAYKLNLGFVPIRKPGKLPYRVEQESYELEYGSDKLEVHMDATASGERVVLIDDLLATGGTAMAASRLLNKIGANVVGIGFIVVLEFLSGREKLPKTSKVFSVLQY